MEFKVTQIRDTRERISIKHIKSLDIVEKEVHRIMPNSLTESQMQREMRMQQPKEATIEAIKNDLENDDIFTILYRGEHQGRGGLP